MGRLEKPAPRTLLDDDLLRALLIVLNPKTKQPAKRMRQFCQLAAMVLY